MTENHFIESFDRMHPNLKETMGESNYNLLKNWLHGAYSMGYTEAINHPINPWHKVSEELPQESGCYLVKYTIGSCSVLYDAICRYNECRWINAHRLGNGRISITHWMEIPELPKED